jgi:hypothetical protein
VRGDNATGQCPADEVAGGGAAHGSWQQALDQSIAASAVAACGDSGKRTAMT